MHRVVDTVICGFTRRERACPRICWHSGIAFAGEPAPARFHRM